MTGPASMGMQDNVLAEWVYGLAAAPTPAGGLVLCAARGSGLYRSMDSGQTWEHLYAGLHLPGPLATAAVALSSAYPGDGTLFAGVAGAVMCSRDDGQSWHAASLASPAPVVTALAVSPDYERDGVVFAATAEDGVFRSKDRGGRWGAWNFGLLDLNTLCLALSPAFGHDQTLFVGTESGIFRSTNGGRAWRDVEFSEDHAPVQCLALSPAYRVDGVLAAGTESCGLFFSYDTGETWHRVAADVITGSVIAVAISPAGQHQRVLVATDEALLLSDDAGTSWALLLQERNTQLTCCAAPLDLLAGGEVFIGTMDGRVLRGTLPAPA